MPKFREAEVIRYHKRGLSRAEAELYIEHYPEGYLKDEDTYDESGEITELAVEEMELEKLKPEQIVACLKTIQSSVKFWAKQPGRQGYLKFVAKFL